MRSNLASLCRGFMRFPQLLHHLKPREDLVPTWSIKGRHFGWQIDSPVYKSIERDRSFKRVAASPSVVQRREPHPINGVRSTSRAAAMFRRSSPRQSSSLARKRASRPYNPIDGAEPCSTITSASIAR